MSVAARVDGDHFELPDDAVELLRQVRPAAAAGVHRGVDLLPAVNGGDSCRAAHAAPRRVPASLATARSCPGLTLPPPAVWVSASPAATRMLRAALASRSWTTPQAWQAQAR